MSVSHTSGISVPRCGKGLEEAEMSEFISRHFHVAASLAGNWQLVWSPLAVADSRKAAEAPSGKKAAAQLLLGTAYSTQNYDPSTTSSALALGLTGGRIEGLYGLNFHDLYIQ